MTQRNGDDAIVNAMQRQRLLREFGVVSYRLRDADGGPDGVVAAAPEPVSAAAAAAEAEAEVVESHVDCVLVLPSACPPRLLDLVGRAMHAFGPRFARAPRVAVSGAGLEATVPAARAYLAFGEVQARALGRELPAALMTHADVVLLDPPEELVQAAAKRRLWSAVNALRRRWRTQAGEEK